jgi:hypothetical protein
MPSGCVNQDAEKYRKRYIGKRRCRRFGVVAAKEQPNTSHCGGNDVLMRFEPP